MHISPRLRIWCVMMGLVALGGCGGSGVVPVKGKVTFLKRVQEIIEEPARMLLEV